MVPSDELSGHRVRVNAVLPSVMDTPANRASLSAERMRNSVATGDVASVIALLCSDVTKPDHSTEAVLQRDRRGRIRHGNQGSVLAHERVVLHANRLATLARTQHWHSAAGNGVPSCRT